MKKSQLNAIAYEKAKNNAIVRYSKIKDLGMMDKFESYRKSHKKQTYREALANFCRKERIK